MSDAVSTASLDIWAELPPAFDVIPVAEAKQRACLPLRAEDGSLQIVVAESADRASLVRWLDQRLSMPYRLQRIDDALFDARLNKLAAGVRAVDLMGVAEGQTQKLGNEIEILSIDRIQEESSPIVRLTNSIIFDAYQLGASDIHFESTPLGLRVKFRLDGVLTIANETQGANAAEQAISRLKIMSELDIAERRIPQDGRLRVAIEGREVDIRVSIMPSIHGEDAVLRILDKTALLDHFRNLSLESLAFDASHTRALRRLAHEPYGMLLVTGPTGSGKTTTLYAMLNEINDGRDKIVTIEDPVEYQLPDVLQIPVNEKKGLTFARGLRSILRHDPDKIMVGEIRDLETAQIAVQSALTGHLVFTTVHANNALDVLDRFHHMGVPLHSFVACLNGVLAQRLVRINCPKCTTESVPTPDLLRDSVIFHEDLPSYRFRKGHGCEHCRGTGYKGRRAIPELLKLDPEIREAIVGRTAPAALRSLTRTRGMRTLRESALELVKRGETTLEEVNRVTFVD